MAIRFQQLQESFGKSGWFSRCMVWPNDSIWQREQLDKNNSRERLEYDTAPLLPY
jgi:hypothetical protein